MVLHATMGQVRRSHDLSYWVSCDFSGALLVTVCGVLQWFILAVEGARADNPHCSSVLLIDYLRLHF